MKSNVRYVSYRDEAHRDQLVDEYRSMGYFVSVEDDRVRVSSKAPPKVVTKKKYGRKR